MPLSRVPGPSSSTNPTSTCSASLRANSCQPPGTVGARPFDFANSIDPLGEFRGFLFILADEVLPSGKIVRKVTVAPPAMVSDAFVANPEIFGLQPRNLESPLSIGEHALGENSSRFMSGSTLPKGAPNIKGTPYYIDVAKAEAAGARIHTTTDIVADLERLAAERPHLRFRVDLLKNAVTNVESEVLVEGAVPASAVKSPLSMKMTRGLRGVQFVGVVLSVTDLARASRQSIQQHSAVPLAAESIRQTGSWSGAFAGARIGGMAGAALGIESGPGAILTGAVGAMIFGAAGYFGADWVAHWTFKK